MNTASAYNVNQDYNGQRNVLVPTRMYSRNTLLNAMHIKSDKYLGINLDRYVMTFHNDKTSTKGNPEHEIAFSKIKSLEADVTKADAGKYYLKVHTEEGDLSFKFKNARDFHSVVEALRNTIHNEKPLYEPTESYKQSAKLKEKKGSRSRSNSPVSSDDEHDFKAVDGDRANRELKANKKDLLKENKEIFKDNKDAINDDKYNAHHDKELNKNMFKDNKEVIKNEYDSRRENANVEYEANKEVDKGFANREYKHDKNESKDLRDFDNMHNKGIYKDNKAKIGENKEIDKDSRGFQHDKNKQAKELAEDNIKAHVQNAKDDIRQDDDMKKARY